MSMVGLITIGFAGTGVPVPIDPPVVQPACGEWRQTIEDWDLGGKASQIKTCETNGRPNNDFPNYEYKHPIKEHIYENGYRYACGIWKETGVCTKASTTPDACRSDNCAL